MFNTSSHRTLSPCCSIAFLPIVAIELTENPSSKCVRACTSKSIHIEPLTVDWQNSQQIRTVWQSWYLSGSFVHGAGSRAQGINTEALEAH